MVRIRLNNEKSNGTHHRTITKNKKNTKMTILLKRIGEKSIHGWFQAYVVLIRNHHTNWAMFAIFFWKLYVHFIYLLPSFMNSSYIELQLQVWFLLNRSREKMSIIRSRLNPLRSIKIIQKKSKRQHYAL